MCATALQLHPWLTAAFLDDEIDHILKIYGSPEKTMFFVGVGKGDESFLDTATLRIIEKKINTTTKHG